MVSYNFSMFGRFWRYDEFKDRLFKVAKQSNSHRFYLLIPISEALANQYLPKKKWENRRKNRRPYCVYIPLPDTRLLVLCNHRDKKKFLEDIKPLLELNENYQIGKLTKGVSIDDIYLLRKEGNRLYLQPHPKAVKQMWWEIEKILNTGKFYRPFQAVWKINEIRRRFYEDYKDVYIPYDQLKAFDRRLQKKLFNWFSSKKLNKHQKEQLWEKVFKFCNVENRFNVSL